MSAPAEHRSADPGLPPLPGLGLDNWYSDTEGLDIIDILDAQGWGLV